MPDTLRETRRDQLTFERGLNEYFEESMLPDGAVARLRNWEAMPTGELRARAPWNLAATTSAPSTRKGSGVGYFTRLGSPALVQASDILTAADTASLSGTLTFPVPTRKGNLIVIIAMMGPSDGATSHVTPTNFSSAVLNTDTNTVPRVAIDYRANAPITSTISLGAILSGFTSATGYAQAFEFSGLTLTSPVDVTASDADSAADSDLASGTTGATAQAVELVVAMVGITGTNADTQTFSSLTSGYSSLGTEAVTGSVDLMAQMFYKVTTATGTQSLTGTNSGSFRSCGAIVAFKAWHTTATLDSITQWLVAQNDTTEYDIFTHDRGDLTTGAWTLAGSVAATDPSSLVAFAPGMGRTWFTNQQFTSLYYYDGVSLTAATASPAAGRCVAVHKNRVWMAGSNAYPGRLWFSAINDGESWTTTTDYVDVSFDDGEPIEDIVPLGNDLYIGKRTGLWILSGSGPDSFVLQKLPIGGCAPGRTLMPTPYGVVAAGRSFIWLVNGLDVKKISLPISESYLFTSSYFTSSFVDDQYYLCDALLHTVWVLNMQTGVWREESYTTSSTEAPAQVYNHDQTQVYAPAAATVGSLLSYRDFPTVTRGKDFNTLAPVYDLRTARLFPVGPEETFTPKHLFLRIRQHGGTTGQAAMTVTPSYAAQDGTLTNGTVHSVQPKASAGVFRERIDLGNKSGVSGVRFQFTQTMGTTDADTFDIEEATFEYDVERVR